MLLVQLLPALGPPTHTFDTQVPRFWQVPRLAQRPSLTYSAQPVVGLGPLLVQGRKLWEQILGSWFPGSKAAQFRR